MFGIGFQELIIILLIALIIVGPERMPDLARKVGTTIRDLRRMYDNLRGELGTDYEEVEQAIRTLRSLDPRRELNTYSRKVLDELAQEAGPEAQTLLQSSPAQLTESLKQSLALNPAATVSRAESASSAAVTSEAAAEPAAAVDNNRNDEPDRNAATAAPAPVSEPVAARRRARTYAGKSEPAQRPHLPDPAITRLSRDLLGDHLLDRPVKEAALDEVASNGHEPI